MEGYTAITCICAVVVAIAALTNVSPITRQKLEDNGENQIIETDAKKIAFNNL